MNNDNADAVSLDNTWLVEDKTEKVSLTHSWLVLATGTLAVMFLYIHATSFTSFLSVVAVDLGVDPGEVGQIFTARLFGDAVFYLCGGIVADRFGIRFVLTAGCLITAFLMACVCFLGYSLNLLLVYYFLHGIAGGIMFPCVGRICSDWFPARLHGIVSSIFLSGGVLLGYGVGTLLGAVAFDIIGNWKYAVFSLSILNIIVAIMSLTIITKPKHKFNTVEQKCSPVQINDGPVKIKSLFFKPVTIIGILILTSAAGAQMGMVTYIGTFVSEGPPLGLSRGELMGGRVAFILSLAFLAGGLASGPIYDRIFKGRSRSLFIIGLTLQGVALMFLLPFVQASMLILTLIAIVFGFGNQMVLPVTLAMANKLYPENAACTMIGLWWGAATWLVSFFVFFLGLALENTGNLIMVFVMIGLLPLSGALLVLLSWTKKFIKAEV